MQNGNFSWETCSNVLIISVTVKAKNGRAIMGLQIAVHRSHGDTEELLGEFTHFPEDKLKAIDCIGGFKVHVYNDDNLKKINVKCFFFMVFVCT